MARPKLGDTETERMQLKITAAEIEAIDDWRFQNRIPSRSEAVRRLCKIAFVSAPPILPAYDQADAAVDQAAAIYDGIVDMMGDVPSESDDGTIEALDGLASLALDLTELLESLRLGLSGTFVKINDVSDARSMTDANTAITTRSEEIARYLDEIKARYQEARKG